MQEPLPSKPRLGDPETGRSPFHAVSLGKDGDPDGRERRWFTVSKKGLGLGVKAVMSRNRRILGVSSGLAVVVFALMALGKSQRWYYGLYRTWKSPDGQYVVNSYRRDLGFFEMMLSGFSGAPWLVELLDASSGERLRESTVEGGVDPISIHWGHESCEYAQSYPAWELPRRIDDLSYRYKYRPSQRPACLEELGLANIDLRLRATQAGSGGHRRFCGLALDDPPKGAGEDPGYDWLGSLQEELSAFHRNLDPYRDNLAGIEIDNWNAQFVVVFNPASKALVTPGISETLAARTRGFGFRVRERCFTKTESECARAVLDNEELWLAAGASHLVSPDKKVGDFRVHIEHEHASAKKLKALLGPLVRVEVVDEIQWGERHRTRKEKGAGPSF